MAIYLTVPITQIDKSVYEATRRDQQKIVADKPGFGFICQSRDPKEAGERTLYIHDSGKYYRGSIQTFQDIRGFDQMEYLGITIKAAFRHRPSTQKVVTDVDVEASKRGEGAKRKVA